MKDNPYPLWALPLGFALTTLSIAFIPVMFFYHRKAPWVGRAARKSLPSSVRYTASEENPGESSKALIVSSNESNEAPVQSEDSLGIGGSIMLNPMATGSSRETQSNKGSKERKSVTISVSDVLYRPTSGEDDSDAAHRERASTSDPESARKRRRSGSSSDKAAK